MPLTSVHLPDDIKHNLDKLAQLSGTSASDIIRCALVHYIEIETEWQIVKNEARKRWENYLFEGKAVTHEAVDEWLAQLEAGHDAEPPQCG